MHAQNETDLLKAFLRWLRDEDLLAYQDNIDYLVAEYFNIDIDKLADEQETWAKYDALIRKELGLDE